MKKQVKPLGILLALLLFFTPSSFVHAKVNSNPIVQAKVTTKYGGRLELINSKTNKYKLHLEGSSYDMGYQHGYLLAPQILKSTSNEFFAQLAIEMMTNDPAVKKTLNNVALQNIMISYMEKKAFLNSIYMTQDMRDEVLGIYEGAQDRLNELNIPMGNLSYNRLLLENMGFDLALTYGYPFLVNSLMTKEDSWEFNQRHPNFTLHMCDGFVATGNATTKGTSIMARNFMIPSTLSNQTVIMEYKPDYGNAFVSCSIPGFVGCPSVINDKGVCIGMDMVYGGKTNPLATGMGCLLTARYVAQYTNSADEAAEAIKDSFARGVSWLYLICDKNKGLVAEAAATYAPGDWSSQSKYFATRYTDYKFTPTNDSQPGIDQIEDSPNLVVATNHFVDPTVQVASKDFADVDSAARYSHLTKISLAAINNGGINVAKAKKLVNYLSPANNNPYGDDKMQSPFYDKQQMRVGDYYKTEPFYHNEPYHYGMRVVFDPAHLTLYAQYGLISDPWVDYRLKN